MPVAARQMFRIDAEGIGIDTKVGYFVQVQIKVAYFATVEMQAPCLRRKSSDAAILHLGDIAHPERKCIATEPLERGCHAFHIYLNRLGACRQLQ